ncbi:unnamed protein product [Plutella xylostella]|uniref:RNA-directed DNA polymerase n=1 Tax=Plutella xylostella TaxID=51655 RepID=A0A8S4GBZ4_PLUXY|nr:unnamed protein product [Plutella xylostella]
MSDHHRSRRPRSRTRGREKRRHRDRTPDDELRQQLLLLRERVIALEKPSVSSPHRVDTPLPPSVSRAGSRDEAPPARPGSAAERPQLQGTPPPPPPSDPQSSAMTIADKIADAIKSINYPCERKPAFRVIRGIGSQEIETTSYVTLPVEFDEVALEVDLFVVEDEYLNTPVIIGTDVLDRKGVTFIRKSDGSKYLRREDPLSVFTVGSDSHASFKTTLLGDDLKQLHQIIDEFSDSFISGTASSTVNTGSMSIKLNSDVPIKYRPYRLSQPETLRVREIVKDLLDKGVIQESESEYSSPILLVKKKNGQDRMCVDFRKLNEITVKDRFPLPRIDDHIDRLGQTKYFTSLDMATEFHQIAMEKESVPLTGFVTPEGHYEYLKMPYGLANAPVVYQRIIAKTLRDFIEPGDALVYIDDVLLLSGSVERGFVLLRQVLKTLTAAGFSINLAKCSFLCTEIEYLGRTISEGQVRPSAQKVAALVESPKPKNVKQVRQFIGLASYFRRYIPGFATKTACITKLTQKGVDFEWGDEQERVRREIIEYLTNEPVLAIYDPKLRTEVHTDASSIGYGAVLIQVHETGHKRVVAYFSRRTQGAESKYHSKDLETLAVVKALQHFRHYLIGLEFTVVTDCNVLKLTQHKKDLLPRVCRWWAYLQDFNFSLEYRKGSNLAHADYLSRNPVSMCTVGKPHNWAQIAQAADEETQTLLQKLTDGQLDSNQYVKKNDVLYYKYSPETSELKKVLTNVVSLFGSPKLIVADRGRMFQSKDFSDWVTDVGSDMHFITPEMHQSNGQVERYCRTVLNMIRIETNFRNNEWSSVMWKLQLVLNITKHKTTQCSPLNLLVGIDGATPVIRSLVRDVALQGSRPNREALREMTRQRASERLVQNKTNQDDSVNKGRTQPRTFEINSLVFVVKNAQMTGKLDSGMRGPYRVVKALPHGRYELKLVTGSYGKTTQAAAEYMKLWRGEWTPEVCAAYFEDADHEADEPTNPEASAESPMESQPSTSRRADNGTDESTHPEASAGSLLESQPKAGHPVYVIADAPGGGSRLTVVRGQLLHFSLALERSGRKLAKTVECPVQPAQRRMVCTLRPARRAADVGAWRVLCALNTLVSTPLASKVSFIHRPMVCDEAAL